MYETVVCYKNLNMIDNKIIYGFVILRTGCLFYRHIEHSSSIARKKIFPQLFCLRIPFGFEKYPRILTSLLKYGLSG